MTNCRIPPISLDTYIDYENKKHLICLIIRSVGYTDNTFFDFALCRKNKEPGKFTYVILGEDYDSKDIRKKIRENLSVQNWADIDKVITKISIDQKVNNIYVK